MATGLSLGGLLHVEEGCGHNSFEELSSCLWKYSACSVSEGLCRLVRVRGQGGWRYERREFRDCHECGEDDWRHLSALVESGVSMDL